MCLFSPLNTKMAKSNKSAILFMDVPAKQSLNLSKKTTKNGEQLINYYKYNCAHFNICHFPEKWHCPCYRKCTCTDPHFIMQGRNSIL